MTEPHSYDVATVANGRTCDFLSTLNVTSEKRKDIEKMVVANKKEQRKVKLQIRSKEMKIADLVSDLNLLNSKKANLEKEHIDLNLRYNSAEDTIN